jgi:hypothetical protein
VAVSVGFRQGAVATTVPEGDRVRAARVAAGWPRLLSGRPTVGDLISLCEENFELMRRLAPCLRDGRGVLMSRLGCGVDLHLRIESQSRYTTVARLTYFFPDSEATGDVPFGADPDLLVRVYHDARQMEVLALRQTALPLHSDYRAPALESKWRINLFLSKWLAYCLQQGHCFRPSVEPVSSQRDGDLLYSCT